MVEGCRILITGGAGFIGTSLALALADHNDVVLLDNLHRDAFSGSALATHPRVRLLRGDVMDPAVVTAAVRGCDHIVHMASIAGVDTVMQHPVLTMKVALVGTLNVLEAAWREGRVQCFIDFSTSEVFGRYAYNVNEGDLAQLGIVGEARWTYAVSKLATEHLAHNYYKEYGFPAVSVRPFNVYGPRQVGEGAIHQFIVRALAGEELLVHNDGAQIRSWCFIDDIVRGILLVMSRRQALGHAFNIGNPRATVTIYNLATMIVRLAGSRSPIRRVEWNYPDVELRIPNIGKARSLLGYEPEVDLEDGLQRTLAWYAAARQRQGEAP
ncbi:MAG: NAD-dependent epimerase/dehydratase family protein [Deltaproteobacteria bacterium]|nr:NAD-dependent epimerase/dehydratase family protein [Deltaproteobacteria bacterium]